MLEIFVRLLSDILLRSKKWVGLVKIGLFLLILLPMCLLVYRNFRTDQASANTLVLSRRQAVAELAGTVLSNRFESIIAWGSSLVEQPVIQDHITAGQWDEAMRNLESAKANLTYLDSVVLFDPEGTIKAIRPSAPDVLGKNFSYRDYYQAVSKDWNPYISGVFQRAAEPHYNVIVIAIPIRTSGNATTNPEVIGILVFTIKLDAILNWARNVDVGPEGFVYFVDQFGNAAGHPKYTDNDTITNLENIPLIKQALSGKSGVDISVNPLTNIEVVSGFKSIKPYGWAAVVEQPTQAAFALATENVQKTLIENAILLVIAAALLYFLIRMLFTISSYRQKERIFLDSVGDGLIGIDRSWNITLWNNAASSLTGWKKNEVLGKPFRDVVQFIHEKTREPNLRFIEETMLFGKINFMSNHTLLKKQNGEEISVGDSASPIFNESGGVDGAIIIFRDISKDREIEKARVEFSSLATHQLRTPITVVNQYTELLEDTELSVQQREEVTAIRNASQSLNELVNAMLNVSRIESDTIGINPEPTYIPDVMDSVAKEFQPEIKKKQLRLIKNYSDNIPSLNADPKLVNAICRNLLSNAIKYTSPNGKITLSANRNATDVVISVIDTGLGIPINQQSQIFGKFFRADNVRGTDIQGTGLGLYTIKAILKQSGGNIWFESTENVGSSFHVSIPLTGMKKKEGLKGLT